MSEADDKNIEVVIKTIVDTLNIQIQIVDSDRKKLAGLIEEADRNYLGYIFGYTDGFIQAFKIGKDDDNEKYKVLNSVCLKLFGEQIGKDMSVQMGELQMDTRFYPARKIGGKQAIDFIRDKKSPMGFCHILNKIPLETVYKESEDN